MPTPQIPDIDYLKPFALTEADTFDQQPAGKGNLLEAARLGRNRAAEGLQNLLDAAPRLQQTLYTLLRAHLGSDPYACGLKHGDSQVSLVSLTARLLANLAVTQPFADWSTWGFDNTAIQSKWSIHDWIIDLNPVLNAANLRPSLDYWEGRMPGTSISRQKQAQNWLREHFLSSLDIALGLGKLDLDDWKQARTTELSSALLYWQPPTGPTITCTAALLITFQPDDSRWLIYRPGAENALLPFDTLESLRNWVFENRYWFWSDPRYPIASGTNENVIVRRIEKEGVSALLEQHLLQIQAVSDHLLQQACSQHETAPLDWSGLQSWEARRSSIIAQTLAATTETTLDQLIAADTALAKEEVHFDCLEPYLPTGWQQYRVERQKTLLEQYLGEDTAPSSMKVKTIREQQEALDRLQQSLDTLLLDLPNHVTTADLLELQADQTRLALISHALCQALLSEARLQNTLGDLSVSHMEWIEKLVDRPQPSLQRPVQACTLELVADDQKWTLAGYITVRAIPEEDAEHTDESLLLYLPGRAGGLMAFDNESALASRLLATLQGAWPDTLLESILPADGSQLLETLSNSTSITFNQLPIDGHFMQACVQAIASTLPAEASREHAGQRLCISENDARSQAMAGIAQKNRGDFIQTKLATLRHLDATQLGELAARMSTLQHSLQASAALINRSLPTRQAFSLQALQQHLRQAFNVQDVPHITLDLADSVTTRKEVTGQSGSFGAGSRDVPVYSQERSDVALETFMLWALDDELRLRLDNATVKFEPASATHLQHSLTPTYIAQLNPQLDMAGAYEKCITDAYLGDAKASGWEVQYRHEILRAPYEDSLRLLVLTRPTSLDAEGQDLLETFCQEQIDRVASRTVAYHSLLLKPGVAADGSSASVGLSAIYIIKAATGPVLLYVPQAPNDQVISQHASTNEACQALERMALDARMARFLATQATSGDADRHESYIRTALTKNFSGFIAIGPAWPEPLPTLESRLEMGALIQLHRSSSRSQADLALAAPESFDRQFFMGLKLALCFLPGVGTAIALYDGWQAANAAVRAYAHGDAEEGLEHLVSLLQSLTDAILSLALLGASVKPVPAARTLPLRRQRVGALRRTTHPVRLNNLGIWDNPGGGAALTSLYGRGAAYWRTVFRRPTPRLTGLELAQDINEELKRIVIRMRTKQNAYFTAKRQIVEGTTPTDAQHAAIATARKQLSEELNKNIEFNERSIARLREHRATLNRSDFNRFISLCEENINEMSVLDMHLASDRFILSTDRVLLATQAIRALPEQTAPAALVKRLAQDLQSANLEMAETLQVVEGIARRHHRRLKQLQGDTLSKYRLNADATGVTLDVANAQLVRASILSSTLFNASAVEHPRMGAFMAHFHEQGATLRSTLYSHLELPKASLTRAQERHFLGSSQRYYQSYLNHLTAWEDNFQAMISRDQAQAFRQIMGQLINEIEDHLASAVRPSSSIKPVRGPSQPRLFDTVEGPRIGSEFTDQGHTRMRINQPHSDQAHAIYARNESGQWQVMGPRRATPTQTLPELIAIADARLSDIPGQQARLRQYQTPQAIPADLEDIAQGHGQQLRFLADSIRDKAGPSISSEHTRLVQRLATSAVEMDTLGRQLRIAQTKATSKPSAGHLDYLLEQQEVEIAWSRTLNPELDRKGNPIEYLEEYRINDRQTGQPLWYAHFHFRKKPTQGFTRLEAGHLKLASERNLGTGAWRGSLTETQASRLFGGLRPTRS